MMNIIDTTLRDGLQAPGVSFSIAEKINIAQLLDKLGVYQIEAGIPALGESEQEAIKAIAGLGLKCRVSTWNRLLLGDLRASLQCGITDIHIAAPVSDILIEDKLHRSKFWVLDSLRRVLRYADDYNCRVTVGAEDASRADPSFLMEFALLAQEMGAERFRYCDTLGVLDPMATYQRLNDLKKSLVIDLEFHGHNDFGMATANTICAIEAGIKYVDTTVGGLGERAGNASLEEVVMALKGSYGDDLSLPGEKLAQVNDYVYQAANSKVN
ncbi:MAG TPA: homocitrate synthase [Syntrophomonadaceae bacterium]|nr:homocitrate synthase [Syntrophomonadaceae bacterium]